MRVLFEGIWVLRGAMPIPSEVSVVLENGVFGRLPSGDPEWIRTTDPQIRNLMLYPAELRDRSDGAMPIYIPERSSRR